MAELKCPRCGREFGSQNALSGHLSWCGKNRHHQGKNNPFSGKHHSPETRRKMSEAKHNPSAKTRRKLSKAQRGRKHSAETRRKMSEAQRGANHPFYGKHHSAEARRKMSEVHQGKHHSAETRRKISEGRQGPKHWNWKGGPFPYGSLWSIQRARARNRDNYTCQRCGVTEEELGHELSVHHIRPFRESKDNTLSNLICLCENHGGNGCHKHCEHHPEDCPVPRKHWLLTA